MKKALALVLALVLALSMGVSAFFLVVPSALKYATNFFAISVTSKNKNVQDIPYLTHII